MIELKTIKEIKEYLQIKNKEVFNNDVVKATKRLREEAIARKDEETANTCWCYSAIFHIQENFVIIYNYLKNKRYVEAWQLLERVEIGISILIDNFDIGTVYEDPYQIHFIKFEIKQYIKIFPYKWFTSREEIIKEEQCSICGKKITLRNPCKHKPGKLYMGRLCSRIVTDSELIAVALVRDPFDRYAVVQVKGQEFNYGVIDMAMKNLSTPYEKWYVDIFPRLKKEFGRKIGRNKPCPCGSGKKFKKCCMGTERMYTDHYQINHLCTETKMVGV